MTSNEHDDRHCQSCGSTKDLSVNSTGKKRKHYICRPCNTARLRRYRATPNGRRRANEAAARWRAKHHKVVAVQTPGPDWNARAAASRRHIIQTHTMKGRP